MLPSTANPLEVLIVAVSGPGALLALALCWDVVGDARAILRDRSNGVKRRATFICIGFSTFCSHTLAWFAVIGTFAMRTPQPPGGAFATPTQIVLTIGAISITILGLAVCVFWRASRHYARRTGYQLPDTAIPPREGTH